MQNSFGDAKSNDVRYRTNEKDNDGKICGKQQQWQNIFAAT